MVTRTAAMSIEALNKIIKEVQALTPDERRELIERLTVEEQRSVEHYERRPGSLNGTVTYMAPDFVDIELSQLSTHTEERTNDSPTLREWLNETRNLRTKLPLTSDSVIILRELREGRSK